MASLENKKIKDTYEGLLKTDDNAAIDGAVEITDGAGNGTGVTISNDGQVTATGTVSFGSLKDTGEDITVTKFVDEADGISNNDNDTSVPTSAAVKDYVDTNVTAQDLDFQGDTGTGAVDLDSQSLDIAGGTGIDTSAVDQTLTVNIDSTVATLSDTQTLTNKTVDADSNTVSNLEVDNLKSGVLDTDLTSVSASDDTLASAKAIKTYVDSNITAQDLDITDGTTTSAVDLDSQTLTIEGTANEVEVSLTDQTFTVGLPTSITTNVTGNLTGDVTGNVTGDLTGNADTASALETARTISLSGDVAGSVSFDGSANADITATIQANSVALGTDTTGDYVESLGTGTGVTIGSNTGEGSSPTISVDYGSTANTAVQGNTSLTIQGTANEIEVSGGGVTLGSGGTVTVGLPNDVSLGGSLTIAQNLTVNGTTTTVNTDTLSVEDPLIELARDNSENSVDVGLYGKYSLDSGVTTKYSGLFKDASDSDKFKLFKGLEVEPTSTVDTTGTGYTKGDLVINDLDAVDGAFSGDVTLSSGIISATENSQAQGVFKGWSTTGANNSSGAIRLGNNASYQGRIDYAADGNTEFMFDNTYASGIYTFSIAGSEKLRLDSSGRLGIGVSSPSAQLHLTNSNDAVVKIESIGTDSTDDSRIELITTNGTFSIQNDRSIGTSGALTFAGNTSDNIVIDHNSGSVGIGVSSPRGILDIDGTRGAYFTTLGSGSYQLIGGNTTSASAAFRIDAVSTGSGAELQFATDGTERMTIDSSGDVTIGVGTNFGNKLTIYDDLSSGSTPFVIRHTTGDDLFSIYLNQSTGETRLEAAFDGSTDHFTFYTQAAERLRIDSSGVVSVGSTNKVELRPESYGGAARWYYGSDYWLLYHYSDNSLRFQYNGLGSDEIVIDSSGNLDVSGTIRSSANEGKLVLNSTATNGKEYQFISIDSGNLGLFDGTAYRLWVAGSGSVGIGTSSPSGSLSSGGLDVIDRIAVGSGSVGTPALHYRDDTDTGIYFGTGIVGLVTAGSERMAIDSSGNVSIRDGKTLNFLNSSNTAGSSINCAGGGTMSLKSYGNEMILLYEDSFITFKVGSESEKMRISSGGNVLVGCTSLPDASTSGFVITGTSSGNRSSSGSSTTAYNHLLFYNGNGAVGSISTSGSATAYNTSSDYRLKENVVDLTGALDRVDQLEPKRFNFIADEDTTVDGFLAHEVQDIVPEAVTGDKDATEEYEVSPEVLDDEGNVVEEAVMGTRDVYQGIDQSKLVPLLVGAIKELNAKVAALEAQINN